MLIEFYLSIYLYIGHKKYSIYPDVQGSTDRGWSGFATVLSTGVLLVWIIVEQGPTALAVGAHGGCLDIFSLVCHFSLLFPSP